MNFRIVFVFVLCFFLMGFASAAYCVTAEVSDISPSSIEVGDEFTIGVQIENCGSENPGTVYFELLNPPTDIEIKEPLVIDISELNYANSERIIIYHMKVSENASPGTYVIKTKLSYKNVVRDSNITFEVIGNEAELGIASLKTNPVLPQKGETVELTIRIENTGRGTAKSVEVYVNHPFQGIKQSFIGALDSDEDGPAVLTFIANQKGEFEFPVTITYLDDFGKKEVQTKINLAVLKKETNIGFILFLLLVLIIFGGGIYYFIKTKRSKDKTIHQLLQGEDFEKELKETPKKSLKEHTKETPKEKLERAKRERRREEFKREILEKYKK